jgi:5-hydroxyisourate hydrolase-like protein (transthyretin family)
LKTKSCWKAFILLSLILLSNWIAELKWAESYSYVAISVLNPIRGDAEFIFYTNVTTIGYKFNVTVWINNVTSLFAYQVFLTYNHLIINATRVWTPKWSSEWVFYGKTSTNPSPMLSIRLYNGEWVGTVLVGDSLLGNESPFNGSGILAIIEFEILTGPNAEEALLTTLSISNDDTFLLNAEFNNIPAAKSNAIYKYVWLEPGLKIDPAEYVATFLNETFNVTIQLNNVTVSDRLTEVKFKLRYNSTLLNITSPQVVEGPFLSQFNNTPNEPFTEFQFSLHEDYLNVSIKILPNSTGQWNNFPRGEGAIATISFKSIYQDDKEHSCNLALFDVELRDDHSNPLTITPSKGGVYTILPENTSLLTIEIHPSSATIGSNITVSGVIIPPTEGANVTILIRLLNGTWAILGETRTGADGNYSYAWTAKDLGLFELKAKTTDVESPIIQLTVNKIPSEISLYAYPPNVPLGSNITLNGSINPIRAHVKVTIYSRRSGEAWASLTIVETNLEGNFSFTWATTRSGTYELRCEWAGDNVTSGATSPTIAVTIERLPSQITIQLSAPTISFGFNVTISGELIPNNPNKTIIIRYKEISDDSWLELYTKTNMNSQYSYMWKPPRIGTFKFYAWWKGDANTKHAVSEITTLTVNRANTTITLNVNQKTIVIGSTITLNGTISPQLPNVNLTIYYKSPEKTGWKILDIVNTSLAGEYQYNWTPPTCTEFQFYVSWLGDENTYPANSSIVTVNVLKLNSTITLNLTPSATTIGSSILIKGTITPKRANATVTIYIRLKGEKNWNELKKVNTDNNGTYHHIWQINQTGVFEIKTSWKGDNITHGAESQIKTLTVQPEKSEPFPLNLTVISLLLTISLALTLFYLLKVRKQKPS